MKTNALTSMAGNALAILAILTPAHSGRPDTDGPPPNGPQNDQYALYWRATGYVTNSLGKIFSFAVTETNIVEQVAANNGLDPSTLIFVYRVERRDTVVAQKSNGAFVADVYQLQYMYTDIATTTDTVTYRVALLNDEYHTNALGSAFGTEAKGYDQNGNLIRYSYMGNFNYMINGITPVDQEDQAVFTGTFWTGPKVDFTASD